MIRVAKALFPISGAPVGAEAARDETPSEGASGGGLSRMVTFFEAASTTRVEIEGMPSISRFAVGKRD
jgi:hypothetical protein